MFSLIEQKSIENITLKFATFRSVDKHFRIISFSTLGKMLTKEENLIIEKIKNVDPNLFGFKGPFLGLTPVHKDLVCIQKQYNNRRRLISKEVHFLPEVVFKAFNKLNTSMKKDIGRKVVVESGYRSCAYQVVLFLECLIENRFDLRETLKRVALPGYSEHGCAKMQAIDFNTFELEPIRTSDPMFMKTKEYEWLVGNAQRYNFYLSYPLGNKWGVMYEPWHWHFEQNKIISN